MQFVKAVNACTMQMLGVELTRYHRAQSSIGVVEAWHNSNGIYATLTLWGYMWSLQLPFGKCEGYAAIGKQSLPWADYSTSKKRVPVLDRALAAFFKWALGKAVVQQVVADAFTGRSTPMCDALQSAIESHYGRDEVDAGDVTGLERAIEDAVEHAFNDMDASDIKHFDEAVERVVNGMDTDDIAENVVEALVERLRK